MLPLFIDAALATIDPLELAEKGEGVVAAGGKKK
jgi:hypothetical protein